MFLEEAAFVRWGSRGVDTPLPVETGCCFSLEKPRERQAEGPVISWALLGGVWEELTEGKAQPAGALLHGDRMLTWSTLSLLRNKGGRSPWLVAIGVPFLMIHFVQTHLSVSSVLARRGHT